MQKLFAEAFGTAVLVLLGCGSVVAAGFGASFPLGMLPVAMAFGLSLMAMAYTIGPISGCHINPAVTIGVLTAGRISIGEAVGYIVAQLIGGLIGAAVLYVIVSGKVAGYNLAQGGLGQNGWGAGYGGGFGTTSAFLVEVIATFIFVFLILRVTSVERFAGIAGLTIGLTLMLIHICFINVTGVSVNPARSVGPAIIVGGTALAQLWLFLIAPTIGGLLAGLVNRMCEKV